MAEHMTAVPMERADVKEFVDRLHRHHDGVSRDKYMIDGICELMDKPYKEAWITNDP